MTHVFPPPMERSYTVEDGRVLTRSLESHIVDHCNLTCAECCSYAPLVPRWSIELDDLRRDLALAARLVRPRVFKLVGGEPLLHPRLVDCVEIVRASGIAPEVSITTNGLLLRRAPDALFEAVDAITISLYPTPAISDEDVFSIDERAARFGVALNWKKQDKFVRMNRAAPSSHDEAQAIFRDCWLRERCHLVKDGVLYQCTRPSHLATLHDRSYDDDGLSLERSTTDDMLAYLTRVRPLEACLHCFGGSGVMEPHRLLGRDELVALRRP